MGLEQHEVEYRILIFGWTVSLKLIKASFSINYS